MWFVIIIIRTHNHYLIVYRYQTKVLYYITDTLLRTEGTIAGKQYRCVACPLGSYIPAGKHDREENLEILVSI